MDDMAESDPREVEAQRHNLNYIGMDGNIGCLGTLYIHTCFMLIVKEKYTQRKKRKNPIDISC